MEAAFPDWAPGLCARRGGPSRGRHCSSLLLDWDCDVNELFSTPAAAVASLL